MSDKGTLELIIIELSRFLEPLAEAAEGGLDGVRELAKDADLDLDRILKDAGLSQFETTVNSFSALYQKLQPIVQSGEVELSQLPDILVEVSRILDALAGLDSLQLEDGVPAGLSDIGRKLVDYLIIRYLFDFRMTLYLASLLVGIIDEGRRNGVYTRWVNYSFILKLFNDPKRIFSDVYAWGSNDFDSFRLLTRLHAFLSFAGFPTCLKPIDATTNLPGLDIDNPLGSQQMRWAIFKTERSGGEAEVGVALVPLGPSGGKTRGLGLVPFGIAQLTEKIPIDDDWSITVEASAEAMSPWGVGVRPEGIEILSPAGTSAPVKAHLHVTVERDFARTPSAILLGSSDGPRIELGTVGLKAGLDFETNNEFFIELPIKGLRLVLDASEGDGFLQKILPPDGIAASFDLVPGLSSADGFYFRGCGGLEICLPLHFSIGPLELQTLMIALKISDQGLPIEIGATIKAELGPLVCLVENIGVKADITFPDDGKGNLGPLEIALKFKPPNGVGLSIDAGVFKGGGYLYFDFENERYAGALELTFSEFLSLKAIGLITTRLPDGSRGFSLLLIITAEFGAGFQLGYGFTLLGVGGLLGLNRTMRLQPLMEGMRTGAVESIMFPDNIVENAPQIISDLRTIFPPAEGIFLIGPMAKIGWGTPTLISLSLGIIIEIPGNIALVGILKVALPEERLPLIVIQVNFAGAIEFDKKRIYFFAALFESRVLFMTLEGEMGLLMAFGSDPAFVLSVGGFHPRYNPPPLPFPEPVRIAINILNHDNARIQVMGYFGITSNSVQFGAHAELYFGFSAISISGHIGFDALMQFSPFYFIISISASVSLKIFGMGLFGISLKFSLEGPTPWRAAGTGSISFLFFSVSADFDISWGESRNTSLPPIVVMPLLQAELDKTDNWTALIPSSNRLLVTLRELEKKEGTIVLHPVGSLRISQKSIPLDQTIDKVGNQKVKDANKFWIEVPAGPLIEKSDVSEKFAIGQFKDLSDSAKLSSAAYQSQHSGVELASGGEQIASCSVAERSVRYEMLIIDNNFKQNVIHFFAFFKTLFAHFIKGGAVTRCELSDKHRKQMQPFADVIKVNPDLFAVVGTATNKAVSSQATSFESESQAAEFLNEQIAAAPKLKGKIQVIPVSEMSSAA